MKVLPFVVIFARLAVSAYDSRAGDAPEANVDANQPMTPRWSTISPAIQQVVDDAANAAFSKFNGLQPEQLAITLVDLRDAERHHASYRGQEQVYPASVIKLFYLAAAHQWMEDGKLADTPELRRAMRDMIVDSYNEATGLIVDSLTRTTSGPELPPADLEAWYEKRNAVNRYFAALGYERINVNRKPWCEGPYGREMQSIKLHAPNHRNWLTTEATARLFAEIAAGTAVSQQRSEEMLELLKRDPFAAKSERNSQATEYIGAALPSGSGLWSKAGWTSQTRHDAALVHLPDGTRFILVIFTIDHANNREIIPDITRHICRSLTQKK